MTFKVYLIAGEPSGDLLGPRVMRALKKLQSDTQIFGVGGENKANSSSWILKKYCHKNIFL